MSNPLEMPIQPITAVRIKGFKSLADEQTIALRPLTLLAGANSSGKSSAIQPLLLLKQTLEASYDPGPLLLDGPHVRFTSADQFLSKISGRQHREFEIRVELANRAGGSVFRKGPEGHLEIDRTVLSIGNQEVILRPGISDQELRRLPEWSSVYPLLPPDAPGYHSVGRYRCFLGVEIDIPESSIRFAPIPAVPIVPLLRILHVPGLRGNPARVYKATGGDQPFPGTFENYAASVIASWQDHTDSRVEALGRSLEDLGLSWTVRTRPIDATQVELLVGRLPQRAKSRTEDLVNIADMGFGVSQVLPVLVALLLAEPNQMVYLEQPELHLHPRAQEALAVVLVDAANRGVRVVAETHSSLLLLAVQTLVVEGKIDPDKVKLHWFQRDSRGSTHVHSADLDELGTYGDWPVDFGQVGLEADNRYLDAVEARAFPPKAHVQK
jgi:hypothetical protein